MFLFQPIIVWTFFLIKKENIKKYPEHKNDEVSMFLEWSQKAWNKD